MVVENNNRLNRKQKQPGAGVRVFVVLRLIIVRLLNDCIGFIKYYGRKKFS